MKSIALLFLFIAGVGCASAIEPVVKLTNRQFDGGGGGSSKTVDAEKREAIEAFINDKGRLLYRIIYQLDARLQPTSAIYYNASGRPFQKSVYRLTDAVGKDEVARIDQEVVYDANNRFICTKNYYYGNSTSTGRTKGTESVSRIETFDVNGTLINVQRNPKPGQTPQRTIRRR